MSTGQTSDPTTRAVGSDGSGAIVYDDMQVNLVTAKTPAANAPTWRTHDFGIGAGIAFNVLGFAVGDYIDFYIQTSHSMKLNSLLDMHVHGTIPTDDSGKKIKWQVDVIAAGIGDAFAVTSGSPYTAEMTLDGTQAGKHNIFPITDVPAANTTVSSAYLYRLTRIAATSDDYASEVYLLFADAHYQKDTIGSLEEYSKV
jgi:hypothetical protein